MNTIQAKRTIHINDFLQKSGYKPVKVTDNSSWYLSPLRTEKTASFLVDNEKNTFVDWGTGQRGSIIDLVMAQFHTDVSGALKILSKNEPPVNSTPVYSFKRQNFHKIQKTIPGKFEQITHPWLVSYLRKRGINENIWRDCQFLFQYTYPNTRLPKVKTPFFHNLVWKNDMGGYEKRGVHFKGCMLRKDITTIPGDNSAFNLFEGFFDYLSALTYYGIKQLPGSTIVLNSVALLDRVIPKLNNAKLINVYFDNDHAGEKAFSVIDQNFENVIDQSKIIYPDYVDFNDYLVAEMKKIQRKNSQLYTHIAK